LESFKILSAVYWWREEDPFHFWRFSLLPFQSYRTWYDGKKDFYPMSYDHMSTLQLRCGGYNYTSLWFVIKGHNIFWDTTNLTFCLEWKVHEYIYIYIWDHNNMLLFIFHGAPAAKLKTHMQTLDWMSVFDVKKRLHYRFKYKQGKYCKSY
jgi:hypothetical protein